jgi:hypothetical protein
MPLSGEGVRYWKKTKKRKMIRLGFRRNKVIETKKKGGKAQMVRGN